MKSTHLMPTCSGSLSPSFKVSGLSRSEETRRQALRARLTVFVDGVKGAFATRPDRPLSQDSARKVSPIPPLPVSTYFFMPHLF